jgi:hypothetical protein
MTSQGDRTRIVTPYTDPDRWTEEETALFDEGRCSWDVGVQYFGQTDHLCGAPSEPGASFGHCAAHSAEMLETCYPDGSPRWSGLT